MKLATKATALIITFTLGLMFAPTTRAAHAADFLDQLQSLVTNRLANTNYSDSEHRALVSANKALNRNTKTLAADLIALSTAVTALDKEFADDADLTNLESLTLLDYSNEAHAQLEGALDALGTNRVSKGLSNQLAKAVAALDDADENTNGIPSRAHAYAVVFNKLRKPVAKVLASFTAPSTVGGLGLHEDAPVNDQTNYDFDYDSMSSFRSYHADDPEEVGTWTYQRTGPQTGVLNLAPDFPPGNSGPHSFTLTFKTPRSGTFAGQTIGTAARPAENISGTFTLDP